MIRAVLALAVLAVTSGPAAATAQLVLRDGRVLEGESVERRDELFFLKQKDGSVSAIPAESVKELRLQDDPDAAPSGIKLATPKTLAGSSPEPVRPGGTDEQLGAFPKPITAPHPEPVPTGWMPTDSLAGRDVTEFRPAHWYRSPIDPLWVPVSAFTNRTDVTNFRPTRWTRVIEYTWVPKDGWADAVSNPRKTPGDGE